MNNVIPAKGGFASGGKIFFVLASVVLLAAACSKKPMPVQAPALGNQNTAGQRSATVTPSSVSASTSTLPSASAPKPVTLEVYASADGKFKLNYTSDFEEFIGAGYKTAKGINSAACNTPTGVPVACFVLNDPSLSATNFSSAAVSVYELPNKDIGQCAQFSPDEIGNGHGTQTVTINGTPFITAVTNDAGMSQYSETHFARTYYGSTCFQIDEVLRWANAQVFSPARPEFEQAAVWQRLDAIRGNFHLASIPTPAPKIYLK